MTESTSNSCHLATSTVQIDNERVKVTRWEFRPGAQTGFHVHQTDYVVVPMTSGELLMIDDCGNESVAELQVGVPYFRPAGVAHNVINNNLTDFVFIEIEIFIHSL